MAHAEVFPVSGGWTFEACINNGPPMRHDRVYVSWAEAMSAASRLPLTIVAKDAEGLVLPLPYEDVPEAASLDDRRRDFDLMADAAVPQLLDALAMLSADGGVLSYARQAYEGLAGALAREAYRISDLLALEHFFRTPTPDAAPHAWRALLLLALINAQSFSLDDLQDLQLAIEAMPVTPPQQEARRRARPRARVR